MMSVITSTLLDQGTDGEVGGGKKKKRSQSKRNISPPALGHCTDTTLGHPASQSGGFKKYQTSHESLSSLSVAQAQTQPARQSTVQ